MPITKIDYFSSVETKAASRYALGMKMGRWSLLAVAAFPVAALLILPALPVLLVATFLSVASLFWTRYKCVRAWIALIITFPFHLAFIYVLFLLLEEKIHPSPPIMLPRGFSPITVHSMPNLGEEKKWLKTTPIYTNGHLHSLRVAEVDSWQQPITRYGLCPGDEIIKYSFGVPISDSASAEEARLDVISSCMRGGDLTVIREGKTLVLPESPLRDTTRAMEGKRPRWKSIH